MRLSPACAPLAFAVALTLGALAPVHAQEVPLAPADPDAPSAPDEPSDEPDAPLDEPGEAPAPDAPPDPPAAAPAPPREHIADAPRERPGPYPQGKIRLGLGGGLLSFGSSNNFGFALSFGVFVIDNVEVGADGAVQFGDEPFAAYLGPTARVLFPFNEAVHPYVGGFYRHWFLTEGLDDFDTLGARAGVVVRTGRVFFGIGLVYEVVVSECDGDCSDLYPELGISFIL